MLKVDNVSFNILKDVSFELKEDENIVILGSNGAGKTTLAKVLTGLIENGNVFIEGKKVSSQSAKKRAEILNYIPAKLEIYDEHLTLREYLELSLLNGSDISTLDEVLKLLEIEHLSGKNCKSLSSGESQLLLIASAILHNAKLTILDEPTSNLDQQKKVKIYDILKNGKLFNTKVIITHDLNIAYKLGFRVLFLDNGKVVFDGSSKEFFAEQNIKRTFNGAVKKVDDYFVVNI